MELAPFDAAAILVLIAAALGFVNARWLRLPPTIGMTVMGALASLVVISIDLIIPGSRLSARLADLLSDIDFHRLLLNGMLSFLLFAGALHVDWTEMRKGRWTILLFSTVGVALSTALVGYGFYFAAGLVGLEAPLSWCLVFGALISPTDPVSVMAVMKSAAMPPSLQALVAGESLFNDGVGVVVFTLLLGIATNGGALEFSGLVHHFVREAGGGVLLGLAIGWVAFEAMRRIDDYSTEIMITLATVMAGYSLAMALAISGPVAMAVSGLMIGNAGVAHAMSERTSNYLLGFWSLIDELLNAVLFLLVGLELVAVVQGGTGLKAGLLAIPIVLLARAVSVALPMIATRSFAPLGPLAFPTLFWGGLRGAVSIALALSITDEAIRPTILAATYVVVLFSVIIQGGTVAALIERLKRKHPVMEIDL